MASKPSGAKAPALRAHSARLKSCPLSKIACEACAAEPVRATENSPRRKPWGYAGKRIAPEQGRKSHWANIAGGNLTPPSGGSPCVAATPRLTPWATFCRPSGLAPFSSLRVSRDSSRSDTNRNTISADPRSWELYEALGTLACDATFQRHQPGDARPEPSDLYAPPRRPRRQSLPSRGARV